MPTVQKNMQEHTHQNIILCSSFIADPIQDYLVYWNKEFKQNIQVDVAPYNMVFQQLLDANSLLNKNKGINILLIRVEDWLRDKKNSSPSEQIDFLNQMRQTFTGAISHSRKIAVAPFLIGIVPLSTSHTFSSGTAEHILQINTELEDLLKTIPSFYLLDLEKIAVIYNVEEMFDPSTDELGHMPFTQQYYSVLGTYLWRKIRAYISPSYKVIALDCDNTLWKGVCGEDGTLNVIVDKNYGYLHEFLLEKYNEGFLLVLCSKNNENDVWEVFEKHPDMKLKQEHIAAHRINWEPKPRNLVGLAKELNVGLDSFIFVDDNKFETEQIEVSCPEVLCLTLPEDHDTFFSFLNHIWEFDLFQVTEEDRQRNKMYKAEKQRKQEQVNYDYLDDFIRDLNITVNVQPLTEKDIDRAVQLTLRTNQFNLNGIRKTREEIIKLLEDEDGLNQIIDVKDRFGDYGIVGLVLAKKIKNNLVVDTFLLSCRVLGRNVEETVLAQLKKYCFDAGIDSITMNFQPTSKNKPFAEFLDRTEWIKDQPTNTYSLLIKEKNKLLQHTNEG